MFRVNAKIKKHPLASRLQRTPFRRNAWHVEALEPRVLLSADPVLGALHGVLMPDGGTQHTVAEAYEPAPTALPTADAPIDAAALIAAGAHEIGQHGSSTPIVLGSSGSAPVVVNGDLVLVSDGATGHITQDADLIVNGSLTVYGSGHTHVQSGDILVSGSYTESDSVRYSGARRVESTGGSLTLGANNTQYLAGNSGSTTDTLTLKAAGSITFNASVDTGSEGGDLLNSLVIESATNVTFKEAVTISGNLSINATGTVTFKNSVTLAAGGSLTIVGAAHLVFELNTVDLTGGGNILLQADDISTSALGGGTISGTGSVTIRPNTLSASMSVFDVRGTPGTLDLSSDDLASFHAGFSSFTFGWQNGAAAQAGSGPVVLGGSNVELLANPVHVFGSSITVIDMIAGDKTLRIGGNSDLSLVAIGDIDIQNEIEAANLSLTSATGHILGSNYIPTSGSSDLIQAEPIRVDHLVALAATGVTLPNLQIHNLDVQNSGSGAIALGIDAARFVGDSFDGNVTVQHLAQTASSGINNISLTAQAGSITLAAGAGISVGGDGAVSLAAQGAGSDITLGAPISVHGGAVTLNAADALTSNSAGTITATGASAVSLTSGTGALTLAGAITTVGGSLSLNSGAGIDLSDITLDAGPSGSIALTSIGDLKIGRINAASAISLTSSTGAILDALVGNAANLFGEAAAVSLQAATGIGTSAAPLHTAVGTLTATVSGGGIFIAEDSALAIAAGGLSTAGSGAGAIVVVNATGALDVNGAVHAAAGSGHILLQAVAGDLNVHADVAAEHGSISLLAAQALLLSGSSAFEVRSRGVNETLDLRSTTGALTMGADVLLATANAGQRLDAGGALVVGRIDAGTGSVSLRAATSITGAVGAPVRNDITAGSLRLTAAGGAIGLSSDALGLQVSRLAAVASAGAIYLAEADGLTIGGVDGVTAKRVAADGTATALAADARLTGLLATSHIVLQNAGSGALNLESAATVLAGGNLLLSSGGAMSLDGAVNTGGGGAISLRAGTSLTHTAAGNVGTAGGTIDEQAGTALSMAASTQISSGGARLRVQAGAALTLGQLDAGAGDALLFGSSITGAVGGLGLDVKAGELRLVASGTAAGDGIGSAADPLSLQVLRLAATAAGGAGIFMAEADGLGLTLLAAAAGQRVQADGSVAALAADAAMAGISSAATLALSAAGALNINAGAAVQAVRLRLSAGTDLTVASTVTASNALSLNAGNDLLLQANVGAGGGKGLTLTAGRDLTMTAGVRASAAGPSAVAAGRDLRVAEIDVGTAALALTAGGVLWDADADGDSTVNLRAGSLLLSAAGGIGTPANAIETAVASLAANGGSGGLFISESDALSIAAVSVSADQLDANGVLSSATALNGQGLTVSNASALVLRLLTGNLAINTSVQGAGGVMRLDAAGTVNLAAALSSGGGAISVLSGGAVQQAAAGDISSSGGSIDLQAGGAWVMADGAEVGSAGGAVRLAATGALTVGKLDAGSGAMSLVATSLKDIGSEASPTAADLTAGRLRLAATGTASGDGIGLASDALEIAASLLAISAQGGGVFLSQTGALQVDSLTAFSIGRVSLSGGIEPSLVTDAALAGINSAGSLVLLGNGVVQVRAATTAGGTVLLSSSAGSLSIDADLRSSTAAVSLSAAVDLTVTAKVSSDGAARSLDLLAGRDVLLQQGSSLVSNNGVIAVQAGDGVLIELIDAGTANVAVIAGTGSISDGDAAGDTEVDIKAAGLRLTSAGGQIGAANNAIETTVTSLTAAAASVAVAETQGLRIDRVAVVLQRIGADGVAVALDLGAQEDVVAAGMVLLSVAAGDLQVEGGTASPTVAISAGADLLLRAAAGNLIVNAGLSAGGPTSLRASGDATFGVVGDVSLGGASASLDVEAGSSINMADGTVFSAVNGPMRLAAGLNMSLGTLSTGGDVSLSARTITDVGGAEVDVSARGLRIVTIGAGTTQGFGTAAAPIQIQVTTLAANVAGTGAGGLFVREADGLSVDTVGPVVVQRVGSDGLRTDVSDAALSDLVSAGNVVLVSAAGDVSLNDGINADGRGLQAGANVLIDSAGDLNMSAALRSTAGSISLLAVGAINDNAEISIARTGRTIDVQAGGAVTQGAAGVLANVDAAIRVQAGGNIAVASITAGRGNVSLISLGGSIVEAGSDAAADVVAAGLRLSAAVGIGSSAERLDTAVATLSARAGSGGIWLQESDAVRVGDVAVSVKRVSTLATTATDIADATQSDLLTTHNGSIALLTLSGSIVFDDGSAPANGSGVHADGTGSLSLQARGTGAVLDLSNQTLTQQGDVLLDSAISLQGSLTVNAGGAITLTGAINGQAGGAADNVVLHAAGAVHLIGAVGGLQPLAGLSIDGASDVNFDQALTLSGNLTVAASGNITLAGALQLNGGNLLLASSNTAINATIASTTGAVSLQSTGGVLLNARIGTQGSSILIGAGGTVMTTANGRIDTLGDVRVTAGQDIQFGDTAGSIATPGTVSLIAGGNISASTGADISANALRLQAGNAIGSDAQRLHTQVAILSGRAGSGGIWLLEADALTIGDVGLTASTVNGDGSLGSVSDAVQSDLITSNNGSIGLRTVNGSVNFADGTAPANNSSIHADGTGTVSLQATGAGATVDLSNQGIAQQGNVVVDSAISLQGPLVISAGQSAAVGDGAITVTGAIDGQAGGAPDTIVLHADGAVHVIGAIGGTQPLAGLAVDGATDVSFDQAVTLTGDLVIKATGNVQFLGALHLNSGSLTILGASSLRLGDVVITSGQGVIHVDALTLAGILSGSSAASLEVAGATATSAVSIGTGAGLNLGKAQLAALQGFGSVILGRTDQGATSVDVATLASLATPNLTLAGRSISLQGSAASALSAVQVLNLNTAQDLILAGRLALSSASADVLASVGGALLMTTDGQIVTQAGDVMLQTIGDLVIGRIDSRAGSSAGAVVLASTSGTIREANADSSTDIYADLLTLRGRGPLLPAGDSTVPSALDVVAKTLDIDAPTGIILRDTGADGRTRFNLLDGTVLRQQVVADAATPRQASASAASGGINAAGAPDAWSWLAAAHPLQDSRDMSMAMMLMTSPVLSSRMAESPSHWSGLDALFKSEPMVSGVGALVAHRHATLADAEAWSEALFL